MQPAAKAFVVQSGQGRVVEGPAGGPIQFKATGSDTAGHLVALVNVVSPGDGPPLHSHSNCDEAWFVMDGDFRFQLRDGIHNAPAGSFVFVPRGTDHCFQNVSNQPARLLVMFTPAGMDLFFEEFAALPRGPLDPQALSEMAHRAGMRISGPPLRS
jgi:quercetin dioxygenase-like cupin family protein